MHCSQTGTVRQSATRAPRHQAGMGRRRSPDRGIPGHRHGRPFLTAGLMEYAADRATTITAAYMRLGAFAHDVNTNSEACVFAAAGTVASANVRTRGPLPAVELGSGGRSAGAGSDIAGLNRRCRAARLLPAPGASEKHGNCRSPQLAVHAYHGAMFGDRRSRTRTRRFPWP